MSGQMSVFEFRSAQELGRVLDLHAVKYRFFGKSGAILLGYSGTTQDVDLYQEEIERGKDFIQLRNGPFDLDLIFAPDGIERFDDAWKRRVEKHGFPIANIDDIVGSKQAANRVKDRESLPRLLSFREWLRGIK
jgi:hypothetical protein